MSNAIPMVAVFCHDFGQVELTGEFIAEAEAKWPGEHIVRLPAWCDEDEPVLSRQPLWYEAVFAGLQKLTAEAWVAGSPVKRVKSLAALDI